jgi:hypothetical protein
MFSVGKQNVPLHLMRVRVDSETTEIGGDGMQLWKAVPGGLALGAVAIWISTSGAPDHGAQPAGYFKSADNDRVQAFCVQGPLSASDADAVFARVSHTPGKVTLAVIYECSGSTGPQDRLTQAADLAEAMAVVSSGVFSEWDWRLQVNPAGQRRISGREN